MQASTPTIKLSAILWRHQNGAKWRSVPSELGPGSRVAQAFIRWARLGVWEHLLVLAQERGVQLGMTFLDGARPVRRRRLRAYRKEWDEGRGVWKDRPRHDVASHGADAFLTFACSGYTLPSAYAPRKRDLGWVV